MDFLLESISFKVMFNVDLTELVLSGIRAKSLAILQGSNNYVGNCVGNFGGPIIPVWKFSMKL